jgi:hypothetical protein
LPGVTGKKGDFLAMASVNEEAGKRKEHARWQATGSDNTKSESLLPFAQEALALGICVLPTTENGEKNPGYRNVAMSWKEYQNRLPTSQELASWFNPYQKGLGVVTGKISGNVEALDWDRHKEFLAFGNIMRGIGQESLLDRIFTGYLDNSPRGFHTLWHCETIEHNLSLAQRYDLDEHGEIRRDSITGKALTKGLIETRGERGFIIIPPSHGRTHPSGQPYVQVSGGLSTIATISPDEREIILDVARSLTEVHEEKKQEKTAHTQNKEPGGTRPGDLFNARARWEEILEPHGWVKVYESAGKGYWRRPGKDRGISATTNYADSDFLYVFSTSTSFDSERGYSKFSAYTFLNHGGDFEQAAEDLLRKSYTNNGNSSGAPESEWTDEEANAYYTQQERPIEDDAPEPEWSDATGHEQPTDGPRENEWSDTTEQERPQQEAPPNGGSKDFQPYSGALLKNKDFPPLQEAIPDLLPVGLTVLAGPPKLGKSFMVLNIASAIASGGKAFSRFDLKAGECLYLALEDSQRRIQNRLLTQLGDYEEWPKNLPDFIHTAPLSGAGLEEAITSWVTTHPQARLVVVDTLAKVKPPRQRGQDPYQEDYRISARLQQLALTYGIALVLVHHTKKGPEEDFLSAVSGTHGVTGAADAVWVLKRKRGELEGTLSVTGRDIEERDLAMKIIDGDWLCLGDATEVKRSESRKKILDALANNPPLSPLEIATTTQLNRGTVRRLLTKLLDQGAVTKQADKYSLPT